MERRQVFDLPPMTVRVIEHQLIARRCACGTTTCGAAPEGVRRRCSTGRGSPRSCSTSMSGSSCPRSAPPRRWPSCSAPRVSDATVAAMTARAADGLDGFLTEVADRIAAAEVAGFDETGLRVAGKLPWVHCARTGKYTLITCHPKRGREGIDAAGVLTRFRGVAVHDAWAPYDTYLDAAHQLCCVPTPSAELAAVADTAPADCRLVLGHPGRRRAGGDAEAGGRGDRRRCRRRRPRRPGHPGPALPLGRADRPHPDRGADRAS